MKSLVTSPAEIIQILHTYSPCAARAQAPDRIIKYYESNFGSPEAVYKVASRVAPQFLSQTAAAYLMKDDYVKAKALIEAAADQISELKSHGWASREFTMAEARISLFRGERADAINLYRQSLLIYGGEYSAPDWPVDDFMPRAINDAQLIFTLQNDLIEHINQDRSSLNWPTLSQ